MNSLSLPITPAAPQTKPPAAKSSASQTDEPGAFARELRSARDGSSSAVPERHASAPDKAEDPMRKDPKRADDKPEDRENPNPAGKRASLTHLLVHGLKEPAEEEPSVTSDAAELRAPDADPTAPRSADDLPGTLPPDMLAAWPRQPITVPDEASAGEAINPGSPGEEQAGALHPVPRPGLAAGPADHPQKRAGAAGDIGGLAADMSARATAPGGATNGIGSGMGLRAEPEGSRSTAPATSSSPALPAFATELARAGASHGSPSGALHAQAQLSLPTPVHSPEFVPRLAAEVALLIRNGVHEARVHVHPQELGPITVQITLDGSAAQVRLAVDSALTRQVLEQGMPTLAEAMRDSGLTLAGGDVFQQPHDPHSSSREDTRRELAPSPEPDGPGTAASVEARAPGGHAVLRTRLRGGLDVFA